MGGPGKRWIASLVSVLLAVAVACNGEKSAADDPNGDKDGDGVTNAEEIEKRSDPDDPDSVPPPEDDEPPEGEGDGDGDGFTDEEEEEAGTDPNDPESSPGNVEPEDEPEEEAALTVEDDRTCHDIQVEGSNSAHQVVFAVDAPDGAEVATTWEVTNPAPPGETPREASGTVTSGRTAVFVPLFSVDEIFSLVGAALNGAPLTFEDFEFTVAPLDDPATVCAQNSN